MREQELGMDLLQEYTLISLIFKFHEINKIKCLTKFTGFTVLPDSSVKSNKEMIACKVRKLLE